MNFAIFLSVSPRNRNYGGSSGTFIWLSSLKILLKIGEREKRNRIAQRGTTRKTDIKISNIENFLRKNKKNTLDFSQVTINIPVWAKNKSKFENLQELLIIYSKMVYFVLLWTCSSEFWNDKHRTQKQLWHQDRRRGEYLRKPKNCWRKMLSFSRAVRTNNCPQKLNKID